MRRAFLPALILGLGIAGAAVGQTVMVSSDIGVSTTWTANNTYNLTTQIYVLPGATLTIEAGTVIASTTNAGGSLAVCRGAQIFVQGTQAAPVIFTSTADVATWAVDPSHPTGHNPRTGTWRAACNEWGTLTLMGDAFISANNHGGTTTNVATPNVNNVSPMEGLIASFPGDTRVLYGGGNDNGDSGALHYVSLRYGGKVVSLNNELNGLSMGGIGRETDVDHIEIMNNVDDGIETWGGTVNYKYVSIWNAGDDSFDVDQGWRGKLQFGLMVQGYSVNANQGSGVGDQGFEMDGAEDSDWQPVSTSVVYNCTVIGQPCSRGATAWRDNARFQFHNCIFMEGGVTASGGNGQLVKFDNLDGDGAHGYGFNGTLSWAATWTTPYTATSTVNAPVNPGAFYTTQTSGNLIEITDSVFYHNLQSNAYTEATARGVLAAANHNVQEPANSPITALTRGTPLVNVQGKVAQNVVSLDPRPANDALTSFAAAPNDGFFTPANYRGAFAPGVNWLCGWTASQAYGFTPAGTPGAGQPGVAAAGLMDINGALNANGCGVGVPNDPNGPFYTSVASGSPLNFTFKGQANQPVVLGVAPTLNPAIVNLGSFGLPGAGTLDIGTLAPFTLVFAADGTQPGLINSLFNTGPTGTLSLTLPANLPPSSVLNLQGIVYNSSTLIRMTNAVQVTIN